MTTTVRKTISELLAEHAESLVPADGDRAYVLFHGHYYEGVLTGITHPEDRIFGDMGGHDKRILGKIKLPHEWAKKHVPIGVGDDEPITWDVEKGMWRTVADYD